jgi:hypothetical protein
MVRFHWARLLSGVIPGCLAYSDWPSWIVLSLVP